MDLDHRYIQGGKGVEERNGSMRIAAGVQDQRRMSSARLLNPIDQFALVIALAEYQGKFQRAGASTTSILYIGKGHPAVDRRLTNAEKVQVRPV
jgi:hypothetical protein